MEEVIKGDHNNVSHPFHWKEVQVNLPGQVNYNPAHSWLSKTRMDGQLAWAAGHTAAAKQSYLGAQDAVQGTLVLTKARSLGRFSGTYHSGKGSVCTHIQGWIKKNGNWSIWNGLSA